MNENAFASIVQARPCPTFGRPVHRGVAPIDCGPVFLLMPFGFHLAMDTLPSRELRKGCPTLSGQRGITPAFGYSAPHPGARGTLTLLNNVLLRTHYGRSDSCPPSPRALPSGLVAGSFSGQVSLIHVPGLPALPPPTTPRGPGITLARYAGTPDLPGVFSGVRASPLTCRLAAHAQPNRVRYPADGSFTSGCSPPRLATTQLPWLQLCAPEEDFHLSGHARFQAHRFFAALRMTCLKIFGIYL